MPFDGLVVTEKIPQDLRRLGSVIHASASNVRGFFIAYSRNTIAEKEGFVQRIIEQKKILFNSGEKKAFSVAMKAPSDSKGSY
jgi:hypothetical protein